MATFAPDAGRGCSSGIARAACCGVLPAARPAPVWLAVLVLGAMLAGSAAHGGWTAEASETGAATSLLMPSKQRDQGGDRCTAAATATRLQSLADVATCILNSAIRKGRRQSPPYEQAATRTALPGETTGSGRISVDDGSARTRAGLGDGGSSSQTSTSERDEASLQWAYIPVNMRPSAMQQRLANASWIVHTLLVEPKRSDAAWRATWDPQMDATTQSLMVQGASSAAQNVGATSVRHAAAFLAANVSVCFAAAGLLGQPLAAAKHEVASMLLQLGGSFAPRRISMEVGRCRPSTAAPLGGRRPMGRGLSSTSSTAGLSPHAQQVSLACTVDMRCAPCMC